MTTQDFIEVRSLVRIIASNEDKKLLEKLDTFIQSRQDSEQRMAEAEEQRRKAIPQVVPNFKDVPVGTPVVRSQHWKDNNYKKDNKQFGIITDIKIVEDDICIAFWYPTVFWEGESMSKLTHPLDIALMSGETLPTVTMNANQQVKEKKK